jgi:hypothetical protein
VVELPGGRGREFGYTERPYYDKKKEIKRRITGKKIWKKGTWGSPTTLVGVDGHSRMNRVA